MKLCLLSPETLEPGETAVLGELFAHGLERYHVRKPACDRESLARWLESIPREWRPRLVLHQHHSLVEEFRLGGRHWKEQDTPPLPCPAGFNSRACHTREDAARHLGHFDALLLAPVFPSLSKPGHLPQVRDWRLQDLRREAAGGPRHTDLYALGGVDAGRVCECRRQGFTGIAVLGAVWLAPRPVEAFRALRELVSMS